MKRKITNRSVDSVKKRNSRRNLTLDTKKLSKKLTKFEAFALTSKPKKSIIKKSYIDFLKSFKKTSGLSAIILLVIFGWLGISQVGRTTAYFIDMETSQNNTFSTGTLDFSLASDTGNFVSLESTSFNISLNSGGDATRNITIINEGSLPFDYYADAENITGDQAFCADLAITASREGEIIFHGLLSDFISINSPKITLTGTQDEWNFQLDPADSTEHPNKNCSFDLVFRGWQTGEDITSGIGQFNDEEQLENSLIYAGIVLNEFLPNPSGSEAFGEWVELYNNSNSGIDVADWTLYDSNDEHELVIDECFTHGESTVVPPKGFLVIYRKNKNECSSNFTLNNAKDTVRLYNGRIGDGGVLIDSHDYDNNNLVKIDPTPGDGNNKPEDNNDQPKNNNEAQTDKSYARFPDGTGPWYDPVPTPGKPNILENGIKGLQTEDTPHTPIKVNNNNNTQTPSDDNLINAGNKNTEEISESSMLNENNITAQNEQVNNENSGNNGENSKENGKNNEQNPELNPDNGHENNITAETEKQITSANIEIPATNPTTDNTNTTIETPFYENYPINNNL